MPKGRPFKKGQSGNPAGRKKGVPNKATLEVRELARALTTGNDDYMKKLRTKLKNGSCSPTVETMLWHYAWGRPVERVELANPDGTNLFPDVPAATLAPLAEAAAQVLRRAGAGAE